jgi:hypothetical protein
MPTKDQYQKRLAQLKTERSSWDSHWLELNDFFLPRKARFLDKKPNRGEKVNQHIIDSAATYACRTLAAGMMGGYTTASNPWFALATPDPGLMEVGSVREWLHAVEQILYDIFAQSNFYTVLPQVYLEQSVFGQNPMFIQEDPRYVAWFASQPIGSYYLGTDDNGRIDTFYRERHFTVRQLVTKFGLENCSANVQGMYGNNNTEQWIDVVHLIEPNDERNPRMVDNKNLPIRSAWYEKGSEEKLLRSSGFYEFPMPCPRWDVTGEDVYGSSPGMDVLGMVKALQLQQKRKAQGIDKHLDPPLQVPSGLAGKPVFTHPGARNAVDTPSGMTGMRPVFDFKPDLNGLLGDIGDIRQQINRMFHVDLFLMASMVDRSGVTAEEMARKFEEKLVLLSPTLERQNSELLNLSIDRVFNMAARAGRLPPPPEELQNVKLKVQYTSVLARAMQMASLTNIDRLWAFGERVAAIKGPEALDKLDGDQSIDEYANKLGVPPAIVRSDDDVAGIRQQRAEQQEAEAAAVAIPEAARTAKDLSHAKLQNGASALDQLLNAGV